MLGSVGVNIGTRFLASKEAPIDDDWKQAIIEAHSEDAVKAEVLNDIIPVRARSDTAPLDVRCGRHFSTNGAANGTRRAATALDCGLKWPIGYDEDYAAKHWCGRDRRPAGSAKFSPSPRSCGNWLTRPKPRWPGRLDHIERDGSCRTLSDDYRTVRSSGIHPLPSQRRTRYWQ